MVAEIKQQSFTSGAVEIAYLDAGEVDAVVLSHGFASNKEVNWLHPGWIATLTRFGRPAITRMRSTPCAKAAPSWCT